MRLLADGFYVSVSLGRGKTGLFLVDTGCYRCFVTGKGKSLLEAAGVGPGQGGEWAVHDASVAGYPVGELDFIPDTDDLGWFDDRADGILGLDFLARYSVGFDLKRKVMRLWPNQMDSAKEPMKWLRKVGGSKGRPSTLKLGVREGLVSVRMKIDGHEIEMCPDIGSDDIVVNAKTAKAWGWKKPAGTMNGAFYYGPTKMDIFKLHQLQLGERTLKGRYVAHVPRGDGSENLIGREALSEFGLLFLLPERKLVIVPRG